MVKLKRLKIERYRNLEPCDLAFGDGLNVVLGQNGAGKTTLLELISRVLRTNLGDTSDPFTIELELSFPGGILSGRIASREPERLPPERLPPGLESQAAFDATRSSDVAQTIVPDFDLVIQREGSPEQSRFRRRQSAVEWERLYEQGTTSQLLSLGPFSIAASLLWNVLAGSSSGPEGDVFRALRHPLRFDEGLDVYRAVTARAENAGMPGSDLRPRCLVTHVGGPGGASSGRPEGFLPGSFLEAVLALPRSEVTGVTLPQEKLPLLAETARLLGLESVEAKLELLEKRAWSDNESMTFGNLKFWLTRRDGSIIQDHQLSYGQKRLLTFLYYLDANPSIVIADELVNGMHHFWIEESVRSIGDRQAFLTSQNPLLLDYLTFDSAEQVKSSFVVCRTELHGGRERMVWRNFTDDETDMFYSAYRVGIEHVGEILRTRGLW